MAVTWQNNPGRPCCVAVAGTCENFPGLDLFLTDSNGTHSMTEGVPTPPFQYYRCCYLVEHPNTFAGPVFDESFECIEPHEKAPGDIAVGYELVCNTESEGVYNLILTQFVLHLFEGTCDNNPGDPETYRYPVAAPGCVANIFTPTTGGPPDPLRPLAVANYQDILTSWSASPFSATFAMPVDDGVFYPNPYPGTVVISQ